jgi:hypothetical protein
MAALSAPRSDPANNQAFLPRANPRNARSAALFVAQILPSCVKRKRDLTAASHYAAMACEPAPVHFQGSSSSILVFG